MGVLLAEFKQALRRLIRHWGFSLTFILTLALAIGANGGVFAALDAYLFPPLPYPHADRLMIVREHFRKTGWNFGPPYLNLSTVPGVTAYARSASANMTAVVNGTPKSLSAAKVTPDVFKTLGVKPFLGRWQTAAAGKKGGPHEVVLSYRFWRHAFNGDAHIVGRPLKIDGVMYQIVGVAPRGFFYPTRHCKFWVPLTSVPSPEDRYGIWGSPAIVRLAPDAKLKHVGLALNARLKRLISSGPSTFQQNAKLYGFQITTRPIQRWFGDSQKNNLLLMQAGTLVLLLLAAANLGNLALVRALRRQHEFALRMALGGQRRALLRMALIEALPLGLMAGGVGLAMARYAAAALSSFGIAAADTPYRIAFSAPVVGTILALALVVSAAAMIAPLLMTSDKRLDRLLRESGAQSGGSRNALKVRQSLSTLQIALAVLLLSGAALIGLSLNRMVTRSPGFDAAHLIAATLSLRGPNYASADQKKQAWRKLQKAAAALPGVESAGVGNGVPFIGYMRQNFHPPGARDSDVGLLVNDIAAGKGLLKTLRVKLLAGRLLNSTDYKNGGVAVVDRRFAETMYGTTDVVGRYLSKAGKTRIVGVIENINGPFAWQGTANGMLIRPPWSSDMRVNLLVRSKLAPPVVARELRTMLRRIMPDQSFDKVGPIQTYINSSAGDTAALATLLIACGVVALALASIGTYGVIAQLSRNRRREFAVRVALGALPGQIEALVLRSGLLLWAIGSLVGVGLAVWMGLLFSDRLYKASVMDPGPYLVAAGLIGVIVLLASWLPARAARRLDLADVLHGE